MATGASQMMFGGVYEGSMSMQDMDVERRPYHKNCGCALHGVCSNACPHHRCISFNKKISWNHCSLRAKSSKDKTLIEIRNDIHDPFK
ncbi:uncharacterized protein DS421_11g349130 [Arachis hypogaea]|uniref:Uncharacterized protein n=1 Tax=Arachis hypogaea TaxID=3818 RepID=A0A445AVQ7_ARAHY|nr:uncharacterized protein DS421_11g349130 [Arachis hypogaea]RYR30487.1 hypothetical protein Ahy_B01g055243 [Arachis hypogaea]